MLIFEHMGGVCRLPWDMSVEPCLSVPPFAAALGLSDMAVRYCCADYTAKNRVEKGQELSNEVREGYCVVGGKEWKWPALWGRSFFP